MSTPGPHAVRLDGPYGVVAALAGLSIGIATVAGAAYFGVPFVPAFVAGAVVGVLAVGALPSIPTRLATPLSLASGGFVLTRYARAGAVAPVTIIAWGLATMAAIIALEHAEHHSRPALRRAEGARDAGTRGVGRPWLRSAAAGMIAVTTVAVLLWPALAAAGGASRRGDEPDPFRQSDAANLLDVDGLDTRTRPDLGDEVVLRVTADRPAFWRGATFDSWDGDSWSRSDTEAPATLARRGSADGPTIVPAGTGARLGASRTNEQTFEVVAPYATVVFAAPEAIEIETDHLLAARADGTVVAGFDPFGAGARYTVRSAEPDATAASLRAATGRVPDDVAARYGQPAVASDRVRALAVEITAGATNDYDRVRAVEAWLDANVEYSLDAPLPPSAAADTVDWFLFEGRAGWCEQIASSMVVLLREVGVPARLVTGFVPGEHDAVTGRYTVRARDAHAWAEVWFPGVGWQGFDPTATVPLAGDSRRETSVFGWVQHHVVALAFAAVAAIALGWAWKRAARQVIAARALRRTSWAARAWRDLERIGAATERPREPAESARRYADVLAARLGEPDLSFVGTAIERELYGPALAHPSGNALQTGRAGHAERAQAVLQRLLG